MPPMIQTRQTPARRPRVLAEAAAAGRCSILSPRRCATLTSLLRSPSPPPPPPRPRRPPSSPPSLPAPSLAAAARKRLRKHAGYANRGDPHRVPVTRTFAARIPATFAALFVSLLRPPFAPRSRLKKARGVQTRSRGAQIRVLLTSSSFSTVLISLWISIPR